MDLWFVWYIPDKLYIFTNVVAADTKQYCKFPFTSPYTGNVWYRCALEPEYDSDEFCLDQNHRLIECHRKFNNS